MTASPPDAAAFTTELVSLRNDINGFRRDISAVGRDLGEIKTACAVLVARSDRTEQDVRDLRRELEDEIRRLREDEIKPLKADVAAGKSRQWPLQSVAGLASVSAIGLAVWQAVGR